MNTLLGIGELNWHRSERITDRYGSVGLFCGDKTIELNSAMELQGLTGKLICRVIEARKSPHIGDFMRGLFPETPEIGEELTLGEGIFFVEMNKDGFYVGLEPSDGRESDWLNPKNLYRAHSQTVSLHFVVN